MQTHHTDGLTGLFRVGDRGAVEWFLDELTRLGLRRALTEVSWTTWRTPEGHRWYRWLLPRLGVHAELVPCLTDTPPGLGRGAGPNAPLQHPRRYADWLDEVVDEHGAFFERALIWRDPGTPAGWDPGRDPRLHVLRAMVGRAARRLRDRGIQPVLGGGPSDPSWLASLHQAGALRDLSAVTVRGAGGALATRAWLQARGLSLSVWQLDGASREGADRVYRTCVAPVVA